MSLQQQYYGAQLTRLRLFHWNDDVAKKTINLGDGLFLFNVTEKFNHATKQESLPRTILLTCNLEHLHYGNFEAFACETVSESGLLVGYSEKYVQKLVKQASDYIRSLYTFRNYLKNYSLDSPKLVFVADIDLFEATITVDQDDDCETEAETISFERMPQEIKSYFRNHDYSDITPSGWDDSSDELSDYPEFNVCHGAPLTEQRVAYVSDYDDDFFGDHNDDDDDDDDDFVNDDDKGNDHDNEIDKIVFSIRSWLQGNTMEKSIIHGKIKLVEIEPIVMIENKIEAGKTECTEQILCAICLDNMMSNNEEDLVRMIHCDHLFHMRCIMEWLPKNQKCPYCRSSTLVDV